MQLKLVARLEGELQELLESLLADCPSTEAKVQALYTWIAHNIEFDVKSYRKGRVLDRRHDTGMCAFYRRRAVASGFADLFHTMCE